MRKKKLLSMLLSVAMVVSTFAAVPKTEAKAAEKIYYNTASTSTKIYNWKIEGGNDVAELLMPGESLVVVPRLSPEIVSVNKDCTCADVSAKVTYKYQYGFALKADKTYTEADYKVEEATYQFEWAANNLKTEKSYKIAQKITAKKPLLLTYQAPENDVAIESAQITCSDKAHVHTTYELYAPVSFQIEVLDADNFAAQYNFDGGVLPSGKYEYPTNFYFATEPYTYTYEKPVKLGYTFAGWEFSNAIGYQSEDLGNAFRINGLTKTQANKNVDMIWAEAKKLAAEGTTLTAKWDESEMIILNFDPNGGAISGGTQIESFAIDHTEFIDCLEETAYVELFVPEKADDEFLGWYIGDKKITCFKDIPMSEWNKDEFTFMASWKSGQNNPGHKHTYAKTWSADEKNHWNGATCEHTSLAINKAEHSFKEIIDKVATETEEGSKHEECTVCAYKKAAVAIPKVEHVHKFDEKWTSDSTSHWHVATCEHKDTIKDKAVHTFVEIIDKEATETEKGSKHEECSICAYKKAAVEIPVKEPQPEEPKPEEPKPEEPTEKPVPEVKKPVTNAKPVAANEGSKVTTTKSGNATLVEHAKKSSKSLYVSSKLSVDDVEYKVTAIAAKAFVKATKATTVTLPSTITQIKANAFEKSKITKVKLNINKGAKFSVAKKAFKNSKVKNVEVFVTSRVTKKQKTEIKSALVKAGIEAKNIKFIVK